MKRMYITKLFIVNICLVAGCAAQHEKALDPVSDTFTKNLVSVILADKEVSRVLHVDVLHERNPLKVRFWGHNCVPKILDVPVKAKISCPPVDDESNCKECFDIKEVNESNGQVYLQIKFADEGLEGSFIVDASQKTFSISRRDVFYR